MDLGLFRLSALARCVLHTRHLMQRGNSMSLHHHTSVLLLLCINLSPPASCFCFIIQQLTTYCAMLCRVAQFNSIHRSSIIKSPSPEGFVELSNKNRFTQNLILIIIIRSVRNDIRGKAWLLQSAWSVTSMLHCGMIGNNHVALEIRDL